MSDSELQNKTEKPTKIVEAFPDDKAGKRAEKPEVEFVAENIGKWAAKQENPFAEQNRKAAAKKQRENEERKKATPIVAIILGIAAGIVAVGGLIVLVISLTSQPTREAPTIAGDTVQDVVDYKDALQNFFNQSVSNRDDVKLDEIDEAVNEALENAENQADKDAIRLGQMTFYAGNNFNEKVWDVSQAIDPESLDLGKRLLYYNNLYIYATGVGDQTLAEEYDWKSYEISLEIGGQGGGA